MAIETPTYKVLKSDGKFQLREYNGYISASVEVNAKDYSTATNIGFRLVADYIFGNNTKKDKVSMTAPVFQEVNTSEKISMTAPVITSQNKNTYKISFVMPKQYTLKTLPLPNNHKVVLSENPPYRTAVISFSGFVNEKTILKKTEELKAWIIKEKLKIKGTVQTARYDPPWTPWFLRRNELQIKIF